MKKFLLPIVLVFTLCVSTVVFAGCEEESAVIQNGIVYELHGNQYDIAGYTAQVETSVTIPAKINGKDIIQMQSEVFKNAPVTSLTFASGMSTGFSFGNSCFKGSTLVSLLNIPSSAEFCYNTFEDIPDIITITSTSANAASNLFVQNGRLYGWLGFNVKALTLLKIPTNVTVFPSELLSWTSDSETISVTRIETGAFDYSKLSEITIPSAVTFINQNAGRHMPNFQKFYVQSHTTAIAQDAFTNLSPTFKIFITASDYNTFRAFVIYGASLFKQYPFFVHPVSESSTETNTPTTLHGGNGTVPMSVAGYDQITWNIATKTVTIIDGGTTYANQQAPYLFA